MLVRKCLVTPVQHTFLFSFKNAHISNDLHIRLRLPVVISPQIEKILISYNFHLENKFYFNY